MINKLRLRSSSIAAAICCLFIVITMALPCGAEKQYTTRDLNEQLVMAALWMQTSAEYRALCFQAFNLAKMNLDAFLANYKGSKPVAVIVDADETVIDNSSYEAVFIDNDFGYSPATWSDWVAAAQARAIPGAKEFLNYAVSKKVEIFYVSNRRIKDYESTRKNLEALGFPFADQKHLLLRGKSRDKQKRRDQVAGDYAIAFFMGDNLNDFMNVFSGKSVAGRFAEVDRGREEFGRRFILLPNPTYGAWEGALYNGNWRAGPTEIDRMRKSHLNRWNPGSKNH